MPDSPFRIQGLYEHALLQGLAGRKARNFFGLTGVGSPEENTDLYEGHRTRQGCQSLGGSRVMAQGPASAIPISPERLAKVDQARHAWIRKLIDLSRRNNLLFFRELKVGTLDLSGADPDVIRALLQLIPGDKMYFDLVIFDEASQVLPEDAVTSLLRGARAVVAGDRRQLPPTTFFAAGEDEEGADEDNATGGFESILDVMSAFLDPPWSLDWYYRSRDEALIAFSNHRIYGGRLVTFPGSWPYEGHPARGGAARSRRRNAGAEFCARGSTCDGSRD
jgi:AAA domain-containing protein